jgi:DNA-binding XRE family transcriptional regulator
VDPVSSTGTRIARLIHSHRRTAGLTRDELAEKAGLSVRAIRNLERGSMVVALESGRSSWTVPLDGRARPCPADING